jgi:hypothetical protein
VEWIAPSVVVVGVGVLTIWGIVSQMQTRLGRVEHRLNLLLRHFNIDPAPGLSERVKRLADDPARKIQAIAAYREETGVGLAEAKAAVEAYINGR